MFARGAVKKLDRAVTLLLTEAQTTEQSKNRTTEQAKIQTPGDSNTPTPGDPKTQSHGVRRHRSYRETEGGTSRVRKSQTSAAVGVSQVCVRRCTRLSIFGSSTLRNTRSTGSPNNQSYRLRRSLVVRVVSVVQEKGGVGKTTTAMSLAAICAEAARTLVVDIDPQGSASWWASNAGDRLPFDFSSEVDPSILARLHDISAGRYDVVFVDTPGSLEGRGVLEQVMRSSDYVIVPTEPAALALQPLIRTVRTLIVPSRVPYRVLVNKVDGRALATRDDAFAMLDNQDIRRFKASTRQLSAHAQAPASGVVVTQYPRERYAMEAASEYQRVALELFADWQPAVDAEPIPVGASA